MLKVGVDIGSTTVKLAAIRGNDVVFRRYGRHNARVDEVLLGFLDELEAESGDCDVSFSVTGSIGMGVGERCSIPFVQEVVAAARAVGRENLKAETLIDIGGEDAKVVFFGSDGKAVDLRMNGNCAGGTGAFIDQMAIILGVDTATLGDLALGSGRIYPVASRCGVFCKTDIQNLVARNVPREDIAASIFHAVAVQTVSTLSHGKSLKPPVVFCGGPLTYLPALGKAFSSYLGLDDSDILRPAYPELLPAIGTALSAPESPEPLSVVKERIRDGFRSRGVLSASLDPLFGSSGEYADWKESHSFFNLPRAGLRPGVMDLYLGVDSGSTTTKIVVIDPSGSVVYSFYKGNGGDPVGAVRNGLEEFSSLCAKAGTVPNVVSGCSTGYGEDLIKAAFRLDHGIIETIAHYIAASRNDPDVSFILDIGGQDMKAIYVQDGVINRIEINEACSSGCGSFIETFARSLGMDASAFALAACSAKHPCDLGTRCTVFMNSKVKEVLREGYSVEDIAAGLAFSVVRNCLYKVLKLTDVSSLGEHVAVQGGTMRNDAVVRAFELLCGASVKRSDAPELMGAYGCALYSLKNPR